MRIAVIGSTGGTGILLLREAIRLGHQVTAFARDEAKLSGVDGLAGVVLGDGRDAAAMRKAVDGQDAVISSVSGRGKPDVMRDIARTMTESMHEVGVRRLVATSSYGMIATKPYLVAGIVRRVFAKQFADQQAADEVISRTELDWTIARATRLTTGHPSAQSRVCTELFASGPFSLDRQAWARALLDLAFEPAWARQFVNVTGS